MSISISMPAPKNYIKLQYPRKCNHCDYVSNNPQMWHYHNKTHDSIPEDVYCHLGCGSKAVYRNTGGKYTCSKKWAECPTYINQLSARTKKSWMGDIQRKEKTKERFLECCCGVPEVLEKQKQTLKKKWGDFTPEQMKDFRHYARRIRARAQKWAYSQGYKLGRQTYHVDHKLSIWDAWKLNLPEYIVNHPANLRIIEAKHNTSKGSKSSITVEELFVLITITEGK